MRLLQAMETTAVVLKPQRAWLVAGVVDFGCLNVSLILATRTDAGLPEWTVWVGLVCGAMAAGLWGLFLVATWFEPARVEGSGLWRHVSAVFLIAWFLAVLVGVGYVALRYAA